jgi:hypothetical protein
MRLEKNGILEDWKSKVDLVVEKYMILSPKVL